MDQTSLRIRARLQPLCPLFVLLCFSVIASNCGGGSSGGGGTPPPPPPAQGFLLGVNPASITLVAGSSATTSLNATPINGFASSVSIQVSGLLAGVTVSPPNITLVPGTPMTVTLIASSSATVGTATAVFTGTSGSLTHPANLSVSVEQGRTGTLSTRTKYVRTDAVTEYYQWVNTHWVVFNSAASRFFVTDPESNQVMVLDGTTEMQVGTIAIPGAYSIDDTPDHSTLYVATLVGDVYTIDPEAMAVTHRYLASEIGPSGYNASSAVVLSDGTVALLGAQGGIPSVDGSSGFAIWNPVDNSLVSYGGATGGGATHPLCSTMGNIGGFTRTQDRTAVIVGSIDSDGTLCEIVPSTGQYLNVELGGFGTTKIITSPDGSYIALPVYPNDVELFDQHTLSPVAEFPVNGDTSSAANLIFSADSKTLFVPDSNFVYAYSVSTHQQIGWMPNIVVWYTSGGSAVGEATGPNFAAVDGTGLLVGPMEEGFGFVDSAAMQTAPVGTAFLNAYPSPAVGPVSGGTQVQLQEPPTVTPQSNIYFGNILSPFVSAGASSLSLTSPPGNPGPVDMYVFANDGGMQIIADSFSYGPTILEVTPDMATADGGGTGVIYGYGFGSVNATSIPSDLGVTVGGKPATITGFNPNAYNLETPPFILQSIYYTVPPGTAGSADVTVTDSAGSATAQGGLTYLPAPQEFPLEGAALAQGVFDPMRNLYYFTDASKIQVFSLAQGSWLAPINIPSPNGAAQRLWGISLSPDGTKIVAADAQASVIYLVNASNTSSVQTFPFNPQDAGGVVTDPVGVAVSDTGVVYITALVQGGTGYSAFFKLDTNTGILTNYKLDGTGGADDLYLRTELSSDNTRVYFNVDGGVFSIDTATNNVSYPSTYICCYGDYDLALSHNQIQFEASSSLYDSDLNAESYLVLNDREIESTAYVYGAKLSPDGTLLFVPSPNGMDVFDGRLGVLRNRIAFSLDLSANYDALVEDGQDNVLVAITGTTGNGIAVINLSSIAEPPPLPYAAARATFRHNLTRAGDASNRNGFAAGRMSRANLNQATGGPRPVRHITNFKLLHLKLPR